MEQNPHLPKYPISVVSGLTGLPPQMLRRYEEAGLLEPARLRGKNRLYSDADLLRIEEIASLSEQGINAAGIRHILSLRREIEGLREERDAAHQERDAAQRRAEQAEQHSRAMEQRALQAEAYAARLIRVGNGRQRKLSATRRKEASLLPGNGSSEASASNQDTSAEAAVNQDKVRGDT